MSVQIIYREENEELFWAYWQQFILSHKSSPKYLKSNIDWCLHVSKDRSLLKHDRSFVYLENSVASACVFFPIEEVDGRFSASISGGYVFAPLCENDGVAKRVFSLIDEISTQYNLVKIKMVGDVFGNQRYNYLQKYDFFDTSILNYILSLIPSDLLKSCRENHRRSIKKFDQDKDLSLFILDKNNLSKEMHDEYVKLHRKCSGRATRSVETFDDQYNMIKEGEAIMVGAKYKDHIVGSVYFQYFNNMAVYLSGADDPDYVGAPLYHAMFFSAMKYFKNIGVQFIDLGQPSSPSAQMDYYPDEKQLNISLFKAGFGGYYVQEFRGIKYFSKEIFKLEMEKCIDNYLKD